LQGGIQMFDLIFDCPAFGTAKNRAKITIAIAAVARIEVQFEQAIGSHNAFVARFSLLKCIGHRDLHQ
jgi:hypothetical protein